jgi:hypothetical protein
MQRHRRIVPVSLALLLAALPLSVPAGDHVGSTCLPPPLTGPNLVLNAEADPLDACVLPNGEWWLWQGTPDRDILIESRRLHGLEYEADLVRDRILIDHPSAREITITPFTAQAEATSYPAMKAEFLEGENEDARQFVAALVFTDEWSFWFVLQASADAEIPPLPGTAAKQAMEEMLLGVMALEPSESDFLPGPIPAVYLAGADSPLRLGVMDALIRIKKTVGPENSRWVAPSGFAYRYNGPGLVGDTPALFFSFGDDSPEKFTAERHFAVGTTGAVYEMDAAAGGNCWLWEEGGPSWWGEYRNGDTVLRIGNYREGPIGMYFVFSFERGDEDIFDGVAAVRNRSAWYAPFVFSISADDEQVAVTFDPEATSEEDEKDATALVRLEGTYVRK